jgi:hypothetical protein
MGNTIDTSKNSCLQQVSPLGRPTLPLPTTSAASDDTTIVFFEKGKCSLAGPEIGALEQWVSRWNTQNKKCCRLYLGGADETSRANRLRRLSVLMSVLEHLGVHRKQIQTDEEWLRPSRMGIIADLPADSIWLQVRGFHAPYAMPVAEFSRQHRY